MSSSACVCSHLLMHEQERMGIRERERESEDKEEVRDEERD